MAKDFIINTSSVNSWGTRVLTSGIDISQFKHNPVLLYMHKRGTDGKSTPIGYVDNIRVEGDELKGTPVFDMKDPFAAEIGRKWEEGFLRMCSAGLEPIEYSSAPEHILPGQIRATVTRSKLVETSIADIGSNDDSLQLYEPGGKLLLLASGTDNTFVPLLKNEDTQPEANPESGADNNSNNNQINFTMNKILLTLGLPATATEDDAVSAITALKTDAGKAEKIELARIESAITLAVNDKRITADKRDHFLALGKAAGYDAMQSTLDLLKPTQKPTDIIGRQAVKPTGNIELAFSELDDDVLLDMRTNNRPEYIKLYKKEFGFEPVFEK